MKIKAIYLEVIRVFLLVLFLYTAASKLLDYEKFVVQIGQSPMLKPYDFILAWAVPVVELVVVVLLVVPRLQLAGYYASFGLMVMFTLYVAIILNNGDKIPCSCGGVIGQLGWKEHLVFNILFTLLSLSGILLQEGLTVTKTRV